MRGQAPLLLSLCLLGCAIAPAGEDAKGKGLRAEAEPVLAALRAYNKDHRAYPSSLYELVPRYLAAVPFQPGMRYDPDAGVVAFAYSHSFPRDGGVVCAARLGELTWSCKDSP